MKNNTDVRREGAHLLGQGTVIALLLVPAACARAFTMDDVHFWSGDGTNRAAVVVDWSAVGTAPLVWGWRWDGDATFADAVKGLVRDDPRLHGLVGDTDYGLSLYALGYERSDTATAFLFDYNSGNVVAQASDTNALAAGGWFAGYWSQWTAPDGETFDGSSLGYGSGLSFTPLVDGSWHVLQFQRPEWGWDSHPLSGEPVAAESPFAWRVVEADVSSGGDYGNPNNALGHPTLTVPGWGEIPPTTVNPASPAWGPNRLVSLVSAVDEDSGGSITVEFDHNVVDDPRNPFGLDFIVFGNTMQTIGGNVWFDGVSDPATVVFSTDAIVAEPGRVEVSADGEHWFVFTNGPYADSFAPTMGFLYDPEHPDRTLFGDSAYTNEWWGAPSDATRPVDPNVTAADFKGKSLADYARLYDGSAGGTGFDISGFDLPHDESGRKYIRFIRITALEPGDETEIDAIADVSPAPSFRNWVDANYVFTERPSITKNTVCANGAQAFVNAAFGLAPDAPAPPAWSIEGFEPTTRTLVAPFAPYASDLVRIQASSTLTNTAWTVSLPLWAGTNSLGRPLLHVQDSTTEAAPTAFFRLKLVD